MRIADRDSATLAGLWGQSGLELDWKQRLNVLYEFTLFYLHITDLFVAQHAPRQREGIIDAVTYAAWDAHLTRAVAEPIPRDLTDPDTAENWKLFAEDLQLRHQLLANYVWERDDNPANPDGTLIWEFAKFRSRSVGRPEHLLFVFPLDSAQLLMT